MGLDVCEKRSTCCPCFFLTKRTCVKFVKAAVGGPEWPGHSALTVICACHRFSQAHYRSDSSVFV